MQTRQDGADLEACYRYTVGRQTREGGFCFYTHREWGVEDPNAPDTCAAIEILARLGRRLPERMHCIAWLRAQQDDQGGFPTLTIGHAVLRALKRLGAGPERSPRSFIMHRAERLQRPFAALPGAGWLVEASQCAELCQTYEIGVTGRVQRALAETLRAVRASDGAYGLPASNLPDCARALTLAVSVGLPAPVEVLSYARRCEGAPFGFNITPLAVSSALESQHAALQILQYFGARPRDSGRIRSYVASCQNSSGGFGRAPGAIARLDDTFRAVEILAMLHVD